MRNAVGLCRLTLRVVARAEHPPRVLIADRVAIVPGIGRDGVVGDVGRHPRRSSADLRLWVRRRSGL